MLRQLTVKLMDELPNIEAVFIVSFSKELLHSTTTLPNPSKGECL